MKNNSLGINWNPKLVDSVNKLPFPKFKTPKMNLEKIKSIGFDKIFKIGVLLIGMVIIFQLSNLEKRVIEVKNATWSIEFQLEKIRKGLR